MWSNAQVLKCSNAQILEYDGEFVYYGANVSSIIFGNVFLRDVFFVKIVAIDGPSGAGKGTVASYLAMTFGWTHIDSGLVYRYVGWLYSQSQNTDPLDAHFIHTEPTGNEVGTLDEALVYKVIEKISTLTMDKVCAIEADLRGEKIAAYASKMGKLPEVRTAVTTWLRLQVEVAGEKAQKSHPHSADKVLGAVIDGRDIISHVFPKADAKIFITADDAVRYKRRFKESSTQCLDLEHVAKAMSQRDSVDKAHAQDLSLLKTSQNKDNFQSSCQPGELYILDTTHLSIDEACHNAAHYVTKSCMLSARSK